MEHYHIKEMEKIFGISKPTLRYWESEGLIHMNRNQENNYREYSIPMMFEIIDIISYRMMNIPLKEIKNINISSHRHLQAVLQEKEEDIQNQIKRLETAKAYIKRKQAHLDTYEKLITRPYQLVEPSIISVIPFEFDSRKHWLACQEDCSNFAIYLNNKEVQYALVLQDKGNEGTLWEKGDKKMYMECIIKVPFDNLEESNIEGHRDYLEKEGWRTGCVIAQLLFTSKEEKCYDYYHGWIEVERR